MDIKDHILFDAALIAAKVDELGSLISRDYEGKDPVLVCILKAAVVFTADLARRISCPVTIEFIQAASYGMNTTPSGNVVIKNGRGMDIKGRHVLLVDAIIDTGETLHCLFRMLAEQGPASLNAVVLLDKKCRRTIGVPIQYRGFVVPDAFVVGYGLDRGEQYRNLPYIAALPTDAE